MVQATLLDRGVGGVRVAFDCRVAPKVLGRLDENEGTALWIRAALCCFSGCDRCCSLSSG